MKLDELLTVKDVSKILKTNIDYVHKLRKAGLIPFMKLGSLKCTRTSLEAFLNNYSGKDVNKLI